MVENDKCWCECKKSYVCEKDYVWNPATCNCENGKLQASITDDSAIICDEIIHAQETNLDKKNITCKTQNLYVLLVFLLITIVLFIAVSIYYYLIKYQAKQKHLLPFHDTKLKEVDINNINWVIKLKI